jgi:predicted HAD superfamily phosphohydrolase YqeG
MPDILRHFNIARQEQICIIGDRITTDIENGCYTILVEPLMPKGDNLVV